MKKFIFVFTALFISNSTLAYVGAVATSSAGSGRASIDVTSPMVLNPGLIPLSKGYFFTSTYSFLNSGQSFNIGLVDNMADTVVPTALNYSQVSTVDSYKNVIEGQTTDLSFGNFLGSRFSLGFGFHYHIDTLPNEKHSQTNMNVGGLYGIAKNFNLGFVVENFVQQDLKMPEIYKLKPKTSFGLSYDYKKFVRVKTDIESTKSNSFDRPSFTVGVESYWNRWAIFRLGAKKISEDQTDEYGIGVGFKGPKFAFQYGYLSSPQSEKRSYHAIDLAIPIW